MGVKKQILEYLSYKQISINAAEVMLNWPKGALGKPQSISSDKAGEFITHFDDVSPEWLLTGQGDMLKKSVNAIPRARNIITIQGREGSEKLYPLSCFKLYDMNVSAGFSRLFSDDGGQSAIGTISIPNMPKCDGAVRIVGDSMYPLLKSGDIIAFRKVGNIESILYGDMYILQLEQDSDISVVVKYVKKSEKGEEYLNLVSYNKEYDLMDVRKDSITGLAKVIISIRQCSMV